MPAIVGREVGSTGFGLMSLTSPMGPGVSNDIAFAAMDAALATGANFWNGGQFYGTPDRNSLHLLRDYFTARPEAASKVVLSIKGGLNAQRIPDGSEEFVRKSVEQCIAILPPHLKKIDIFECARVDPKTPIEATMQALRKLVEEGKIGAVGLSEVKAETIKSANQFIQIAGVEVEFSLFETSILKNSVAETCASLNIPIIAYSPLGRGILTGTITTAQEIPTNSPLRRLCKFQGENIDHNMRLVQELKELSLEYRPHTMAQLALSWIRCLSGKKGLPVMLPISGSSKAENVKANSVEVRLTEEDLEKIGRVLEEKGAIGERSYAEQKQYMEG